MIERDNTNELRGQMDLGDLMAGEGTTPPGADAPPSPFRGGIQEGYDAEGHLTNPATEAQTYEGKGEDRGTSSVTADAVPPTTGLTGPVSLETAHCAVSRALDAPEGKAFGEAGEVADPDRLATLAVEINAITEQTRGVVISAALAVGKRLIEARSICPAGRFGEWLAKSVNYSERKAQDMMRLYVEYGRDGCVPEAIAALDYSKAVALLGAPADEREALAERAAAEDMSVRDLNAEIKRLKAEADQAQLRFDIADKENKEKDDLIRDYDRGIEKMHEELNAANAAIEREREAARLAQAKATAAEASAGELRRLRSDAEDRAAASAQRASDAVNRANQTAKDLAEARAKIQALSEAAAAAAATQPEPVRVEVVPEAITKELADLRARLAEKEARVGNSDTSSAPDGAPSPQGEGSKVTASEKFKWFYNNQMKPAFTTALDLLREVAREDPKAADLFATALTRGCQQLMNQLGTQEG